MNDINSLIIEGVVKDIENDFFVLRSYRTVRTESGDKQIHYSFKVRGHFGDIKVGYRIRIVGKLISEGDDVFILSEHTEIHRRSEQ